MSSKVYFMDDRYTGISSNLPAKAAQLFEHAGLGEYFEPGESVAVKCHMGEWFNTAYLRPILVRAVVDLVKEHGGIPFVTDMTTAPYYHYGSRSTAKFHLETANRRRPPRVLLVGYNGANNTGSEARLIAIIEDVREVFGPRVRITVPTLNERNLRRYVEEGPDLRIEPIPSIFFFALRRLVKEHDLIMLVEGSCYMDTWTPALLWAFLWATRCAHDMGKPSLAYAVDAGHLSPGNQKRVMRDASKTDLIITRTQAAANLLRSWGVTASIEVTADNAFYFRMNPADRDLLQMKWPEASDGVVGMALVDFYLWPVVIRLWGRAEYRYRWPYYFSRSKERLRATRRLAEGFAAEADRLVEEHDKNIALIAMEELDTPLVRRTFGLMAHPERARVFSSSDYNASQMTSVLRSLDLLVSSRYHACVMCMAAGVPLVAVGHDLRIEGLFRDLGLYDDLFIPHTSEGLFPLLREMVDRLVSDPGPTREAVLRGHEEHMERALRNRELLRTFAAERGWEVMG